MTATSVVKWDVERLVIKHGQHKARRLLRWRTSLSQADRDALDRSVSGEPDPRISVSR